MSPQKMEKYKDLDYLIKRIVEHRTAMPLHNMDPNGCQDLNFIVNGSMFKYRALPLLQSERKIYFETTTVLKTNTSKKILDWSQFSLVIL